MAKTIYTKKGYLNSKGISEAYAHYEQLSEALSNKLSEQELYNLSLGVRAGTIKLRHDPDQKAMAGYSMQVFDGHSWSSWQ